MADFCARCSLDLYFHPEGDFAHFGKSGAITAEDVTNGMGMLVLCEGCGPTYVDHLGRCLGGCAEQHTPPDHDEVLRRYADWLGRRRGRLGVLYRLRDRLLGTDWEPGLRHELRFRWYDFWDRVRGRPVGWEFEDLGTTALGSPGEDGTVLRSGVTRNEEERGPAVHDLHASEEQERLGPGEGPGSPVR